jgi:hypothetical protein
MFLLAAVGGTAIGWRSAGSCTDRTHLDDSDVERAQAHRALRRTSSPSWRTSGVLAVVCRAYLG